MAMNISNRFSLGHLFGIAVAGLLFVTPVYASEPDGVTPVPPRPMSLDVQERVLAEVVQTARLPVPYAISLGHVPVSRMSRERSEALVKGVRPKVGFPRDVAALKCTDASDLLVWQALPDGAQVAALSIASPEASGIRLGLLIRSLPQQSILRFYAQGDKTTVEVATGREVLESIARNLSSGDTSAAAHTFWTPLALGNEASVEIELPPGVAADTVRFSVPQISHLFMSPLEFEQSIQQQRAAASCNLDASCYLGTWGNTSKAVARMHYVEAGYAYVCTGTLLADRGGTSTPYFLSANHCIADQTTASTLETRWFYRSSSCNLSSTNSSTTTLIGGAVLLYNSAVTDTSFLKLNRAAPTGSYFAGWWPSLPMSTSSVVGIHHPTGDLLKISFGSVAGYLDCTADNGSGSYSCSDTAASSAEFISVTWQQGITESGSSGSGLWAQSSDGSYYLVGTLRGGTSSCGGAGADTYGRFDLAYNTALKQWLDSGAVSTYALTVTKTGSGTVTSSPSGINCGTDCTESYTSGTNVTLTATAATGSSFSGWGGACSGTSTTCTVSMSEAKTVSANFIGTLSNGMQLTALSGALDSETRYAITVPAGATNLKIVTSGGTGDVDVYVRFGSMPTTTTYDCRAYSPGNGETCTLAAPFAGTYYVLLVGYEAFSGVALVSSYTSTPATTTSVADCIFNWAESYYASLFAPAGAVSLTSGPYYYRYYATTNSYLGTSSSDNHLYYIGLLSGGGLLDVGLIDTWRQTAGCSP